MVVKVQKISVGFKMPKGRHDILMKMVDEQGGGRGAMSRILNDAFDEYIKRREDPEPEKERIRQALRDEVVIPEERIREIVQEEFRTLFQGLSASQLRH